MLWLEYDYSIIHITWITSVPLIGDWQLHANMILNFSKQRIISAYDFGAFQLVIDNYMYMPIWF